jgi:hypothetical protein
VARLPRWPPLRLAEHLGVTDASVPSLLELEALLRERERVEERYRRALEHAVATLEAEGRRDAYAVVARVLGVSRQAVRQLLTR